MGCLYVSVIVILWFFWWVYRCFISMCTCFCSLSLSLSHLLQQFVAILRVIYLLSFTLPGTYLLVLVSPCLQCSSLSLIPYPFLLHLLSVCQSSSLSFSLSSLVGICANIEGDKFIVKSVSSYVYTYIYSFLFYDLASCL